MPQSGDEGNPLSCEAWESSWPDFRSTRGRRYPLATKRSRKLAGSTVRPRSARLTQHQLVPCEAPVWGASPPLRRPRSSSSPTWTPRARGPRSRPRAPTPCHRGKYIRGAARHNPGPSTCSSPLRSTALESSSDKRRYRTRATRSCVPGHRAPSPAASDPDAMHTNHHTARCLSSVRRAVMTAVKGIAPTCSPSWLGSIGSFPRCAPPSTTSDKHGRIEKRSCCSPHRAPRGFVRSPFARARPRREAAPRQPPRRSIGASKIDSTTARRLLREDRCPTAQSRLPRSLRSPQGCFDSLPQAHRHYARRPQDAVRAKS